MMGILHCYPPSLALRGFGHHSIDSLAHVSLTVRFQVLCLSCSLASPLTMLSFIQCKRQINMFCRDLVFNILRVS
jgi:hypothetical protein